LYSSLCRPGSDPRFDRRRARLVRGSLPLANPNRTWRRRSRMGMGRVPELAHAPFSCNCRAACPRNLLLFDV
jgi:hypothetical protein